MLFRRVSDPAPLREEDNRRAEAFVLAAKLDYTMMMSDVEFPNEPEEEGEEDDAQS